MSNVNVYLSAEQRTSCIRALNTTQRWVQGDVGVFAELADEGILKDKDGNPLSLSKWSTIVEPALTEYARLAAGTTPGTILDVHDPATHPVGALALQFRTQLENAKASLTCATMAAMPVDMALHKKENDVFDIYKSKTTKDSTRTPSLSLRMSGLTSMQVVEQCIITKPVFKFSIGRLHVHALMRMLDIYSRILMNQWETVKELTDDRYAGRRSDWHDRVEQTIKAFKQPWTQYSMNACSGIYSKTIHADADIVWNVQKGLRHWDMVQRNGYSHRGISTDMPMTHEVWPFVDSSMGADLSVIPVGGGIVYKSSLFFAVPTFVRDGRGPPALVSLASSYSPVSLLDALAHTQANPSQAQTF